MADEPTAAAARYEIVRYAGILGVPHWGIADHLDQRVAPFPGEASARRTLAGLIRGTFKPGGYVWMKSNYPKIIRRNP